MLILRCRGMRKQSRKAPRVTARGVFFLRPARGLVAPSRPPPGERRRIRRCGGTDFAAEARGTAGQTNLVIDAIIIR